MTIKLIIPISCDMDLDHIYWRPPPPNNVITLFKDSKTPSARRRQTVDRGYILYWMQFIGLAKILYALNLESEIWKVQLHLK